MKGDRMPTILSPIALAIGEDYTDQWIEYLLNPTTLKQHLLDLKDNKTNHPDSQSIIKTFLKQYDKYIAAQQINRSNILLDLALDVVTTLKFAIDEFEKVVPIKYQRLLLERLFDTFNNNRSSSDKLTDDNGNGNSSNGNGHSNGHANGSEDHPMTENGVGNGNEKVNLSYEKLYEPYLHRWLIRSVIKGVPLKYLLAQNSTTLSPSLLSQQQAKQDKEKDKEKESIPSTPPSTPPPTPPQFIASQHEQSQSQQSQSQQIQQHPNIQSGALLDEVLPKSIEYLLNWSKKSVNEKDLAICVVNITMELGELAFYRNSYMEAKQYFDHSLAILLKNNITEFKEKNRIDSFLLAISSVEVFQETESSSKENMVQKMVMLSDSLPTQVEISLALADYSLLLDLLYQDTLPSDDINSKSCNLDWHFRMNLLNDTSIPSETRDSIYCLNLLKSTIHNIYFSTDLGLFSSNSGDSCINYLFNKTEQLLKELESTKNKHVDLYCKRLKFTLNKLGYALLDGGISKDCQATNTYWSVFKSKLPTLVIDQVGCRKRKQGDDVDIKDENEGSNKKLETESLTIASVYNEFMAEEDDMDRLANLKSLLIDRFAFTQQQIDNIVYKKSCHLTAHSKYNTALKALDITTSTTTSSPTKQSKSIEYLKLLIQLLSSSNTNNVNNEDISDKFTTIFNQQQQLPDYSILLTIITTLLNREQYTQLQSLCNLILQKDKQSQQLQQPEYKLISVVSSLEQLASLLNQYNTFKQQSNETGTTTNAMDIDSSKIVQDIINAFQVFISKLAANKQLWVFNSAYYNGAQLIVNDQPIVNGIGSLNFTANNTKYGLLNCIKNTNLLEMIVDIIISYIFKNHRKNNIHNEINLEFYGELSTLISNTLSNNQSINDMNCNEYVEILMNTLLRINAIGLQSQSNLFYRGKSFSAIGDVYFDVKRYSDALRYYLIGLSMETSFFSMPPSSQQTIGINMADHMIDKLAPRILQCLQELQCSMQAVVVSQILPVNSQLYSNVFKIIQDDFNTLDINYYQYIWDLPILELLLSISHKQKDQKRSSILTQIISTPMLNEFNPQEIRTLYINNTKTNFWKQLTSDFLLS